MARPEKPAKSKTKFEKTIYVPREIAETIDSYLTPGGLHQDEDDTIVYSAIFDNGVVVDIKCCGCQDEDETSWTEAVVFEPSRSERGVLIEAGCSEPEDEFFGVWEMKHNGVTYLVDVKPANP